MKTDPRHADHLRRALRRWVEEGLLSHEKARELDASIEVVPVNWRKITQVAFVIALASAVIALVNLLANDFLLNLFYQVMNAPYPLLAGLFGTAAALLYYFVWRRMKGMPIRLYSHEVLLLAAGALAGCAIYFAGLTIDPDLGYYPPLFLAGSALFLILGRGLPSPATWVAGCLGLLIWYGTETVFRQDPGGLFLGMNLPLRYVPFGLLLLGLGLWLRGWSWPRVFGHSLYTLGLLAFFTAWWVFSFFGNYTSWQAWEDSPKWTFLGHGLLLALISGLAVYLGARWNDHLLRATGALFFLLNLYTKYVEYAWPALHGALFFLLLALSFWFIGRKAEKLWELMDGRS